ncbi:hypothetical protein WA026_007688 [Henosepilachna vigintioctopunctata]|uniref:Uncharacterized protein n=1 Tax=Henosepilachna vigintioctopunctata TaxID=420089 RepID=A0AAW1TUS0_9CUCU
MSEKVSPEPQDVNGVVLELSAAEYHEILEALKYAEHSDGEKYLLITDSISSSTSLHALYTEDAPLNRIKNRFFTLKSMNKFIKLLRIPSDLGIRDNDLADREASEYKNSNNKIDYNNISNENVYKIYLKQRITSAWEQNWKRNKNKLVEIKLDTEYWKEHLSR